MRMIKPIVNISKIMDGFDTIIIGLNGVLTDGIGVKTDALEALINLKKNGKRIILVTNSCERVAKIAKKLHQNQVPLALFDSIVSAGEVIHYKLKAKTGKVGVLGQKYFHLGEDAERGVFDGLDYEQVSNIESADFMYMSAIKSVDDVLEKYLPTLEHAASLGVPFLCAGNDTSYYKEGKICLAPGALAEQYAVLGGQIITIGKPNVKILSYALDGIEGLENSRTLLIGDNLTTDIKGANLLGICSALISKGVHVNYLGEGYIPDVAKTRELSLNFDVYPDFVISNLRW